MSRVEKLQEIECLAAAYLTQDDPVWAMAEGCFQEVTDAHSRQTVLWLPSFKADKVVLVHLNFGGVFDEVLDTEMPSVELADGQRDAVQAAGRNDGGNAASIRQARVEDRLGLRNIIAQAARDVLHCYHQRFFSYRDPADLFDKASLLDKHMM